MKFKLISLGCKVNSYESNAIRQMLFLNGYEESQISPDVTIINTCSVTSVADQKSRQIIRREKRNNINSIVVVMGCYSQKNADYVIKECNADIVVGTSNRNKILELIQTFLKTKKPIKMIDDDVRHLKYESFGVFTLPESTRAYIKVEDGCNNFCTYCTIPYTRGNVRSRDKDEIIDEIKHLISQGFKEFVLTGIHTAFYGIDLKGITFSDLVEEILKIPGLYRLRISSIEESEIDDKFINLLKNYPNIANHLHMPLQSGSSSVLKRMHRKYNVQDFVNKVNKIREVRPDIAITTDVIVGFPGESEEEFNETYEFIKKVNFAELHVFPFSAREGTPAYEMSEQVDPKVKNERVSKLIELSNVLYDKYFNSFRGKELEVLLEERNKTTGLLSGFTSNYLKISADLPDEYIGKIVKLKVR
ncbi:MAG: tRNA (N(6)-L-threonylcarbamoyladenosine(37)-C(2))-methylthiotransferase MtaB [Bacilli bacterium]|nr:tRNA (N(6)-L-threonylcarbamoyladenosine(37)-C(2))-methylthiotransferase MtaB [Bacilli bacterium]